MTINDLTPPAARFIPTLHSAVDVGTVTLRVADIRRSIAFYTDQIGLTVLDSYADRTVLGAGSRPIITVREVANPQPAARSATGLYHAAILFPDRHSLAVKIIQLASNRIPLGSGDHYVSEAFYLDDPDGNGLELYRDRPRSEWTWANGQVRMATDSIDFDSFLSEVNEHDPALTNSRAPAATKLGHVHLKVADIPIAEAFYHGVLGFDVVARMPSALFVSAGGYHHHIGMNTWESRGGRPASSQSVGLQEFSIRLPDLAERDRLIAQLQSAGLAVDQTDPAPALTDPFGNRIRLVVD